MDSRERTFCALSHRAPDRIPVDFWASAGLKARLSREYGCPLDVFLDRHDVDLRYIPGPEYVGPPLARTAAGASVDIWGVPRQTVTLDLGEAREHYREVTASPLADAETPEDVARYPHWPSADWFDYRGIEAQCDTIRRQNRVVVFMGDRLNRIAQLKPAMYLCGVETIMLHMAMQPEVARAVFARIRAFYLAYTTRILEAAKGKIDIVATGDDFGTQTSLMLSPDMWRSFIRDGFRAYNDLIHGAGARVMHHTCGAVAPLIPDMSDCGLDILQSLQPEAAGMDAARLKKRYGRTLCFQGGVSIQRTLPHATPAAVRREVRTLGATLGRGGGYIFGTAHNIQADTPLANVQALLAAYAEFGRR